VSHSFAVFVASLAIFVAGSCFAGTVVVTEANREDAATHAFKFDKVPAPSRTDAANGAKFSIVDGRRDRNGAELDVLNDGQLPSEMDEPGANFFFAAGSAGGRLLVDLGQNAEVKRIATYSWHPGPRGPQVYKVYAAEAATKDFDPNSAKADDLVGAGWKLLAEVDARPAEGEPGGQYGVSVTGDDGRPLGEHRYLLFVIARTGGHATFDNTFFSEIDIDDGENHEPASKAPTPERVVELLNISDKYEIAFDTTEAPELKPWVDDTLKPACKSWYPKIVEMLPSEGFTAPTRFSIVFHRDMRGVAYTSGRDVHCAVDWFQNNLDGEAAGAVIHELVHVVQQYGRARGGNRNPGWMVEGLADYIRWFLYEPENLRPQPDPESAKYTDSYRTTGAFLDYVVRHHDKGAIKKFNAAMRSGEYDESLWEDFTGKSLDELWAQYVRTLRMDSQPP
jgi:hypothetical protein